MLDCAETSTTATRWGILLSKSNTAVRTSWALATGSIATLAVTAIAVPLFPGRVTIIRCPVWMIDYLCTAPALSGTTSSMHSSSPFASSTNGNGHALSTSFQALAGIHAVVDAEIAADHISTGGSRFLGQIFARVCYIRAVFTIIDTHNTRPVARFGLIGGIAGIRPGTAIAQAC